MIRRGGLVLALLVLIGHPANAGPPFVTDDPEPADPGHFEINLAAEGTIMRGAYGGAFPAADINYGLMTDTQLHIGLSGPFQAINGQRTQFGYGDTEFGLKYRFIAEDAGGWQPQVAVYPTIDLATGNSRQGLGAGHTRVFLPMWVQKSIGDWQSFGGGGYWFNRDDDSRDYWFAGWALLRTFAERWTLGGEVFYQTADLIREPDIGGNGVSSHASSGFNLGGWYTIDEDHRILFSAGRGLLNAAATNQFSYYAGYQIIF